mmetsp:Transcript_20076/g.48257  ORF Transcript_20076/g.48257 Transcript_20076/m.48257 type:complete len:211 (+) Transcript_20076:357-989(+)
MLIGRGLLGSSSRSQLTLLGGGESIRRSIQGVFRQLTNPLGRLDIHPGIGLSIRRRGSVHCDFERSVIFLPAATILDIAATIARPSATVLDDAIPQRGTDPLLVQEHVGQRASQFWDGADHRAIDGHCNCVVVAATAAGAIEPQHRSGNGRSPLRGGDSREDDPLEILHHARLSFVGAARRDALGDGRCHLLGGDAECHFEHERHPGGGG